MDSAPKRIMKHGYLINRAALEWDELGDRRQPDQDWPEDPIRAESWLGSQAKTGGSTAVSRPESSKRAHQSRILDGFAHSDSQNQHRSVQLRTHVTRIRVP